MSKRISRHPQCPQATAVPPVPPPPPRALGGTGPRAPMDVPRLVLYTIMDLLPGSAFTKQIEKLTLFITLYIFKGRK